MEQIKQRHVRETEDRLEQLQAWLVEEEQRRAMAAEALASERQAKLEQRLWEQRMKRERQALERQRLLEQERRNPVGRPKYKEMERRFERHAIEEQELREMVSIDTAGVAESQSRSAALTKDGRRDPAAWVSTAAVSSCSSWRAPCRSAAAPGTDLPHFPAAGCLAGAPGGPRASLWR